MDTSAIANTIALQRATLAVDCLQAIYRLSSGATATKNISFGNYLQLLFNNIAFNIFMEVKLD